MQAEAGIAQVGIHVALHKVLSVDLYGGVMTVAVWVALKWYDPRLTWNAVEWNVSHVFFANQGPTETLLWEVGDQ